MSTISNHYFKNIREWLPATSLAFSVFIFITAELMPVGLLTEIAAGIGESESKTGLLLTGYAWMVALTSLPLTLATASFNRRPLLITLLMIFSIGNLLVSFFSAFLPILFSRVVVAFCHAIFWSIVTPLAARLAPRGKPAYGLAVISAGVMLGTVLGVPAGTFIGQQFSWRVTFQMISMLAVIVAILLAVILPPLPSKNSGSLRSVPSLIRNIPLMAAYLTTVTFVTGHFIIYTYLVPFFEQQLNVGHNQVVTLLFVFGFSSVIGIFFAAKLVDRYMREIMITGAAGIVILLLLINLSTLFLPAIVAVLVLWSICLTILGISFQSWILRLAPDAEDAAISVYSGIYNVGIGSGALLGSKILAGAGAASLGYAGALFILPALVLIVIFGKNIGNRL